MRASGNHRAHGTVGVKEAWRGWPVVLFRKVPVGPVAPDTRKGAWEAAATKLEGRPPEWGQGQGAAGEAAVCLEACEFRIGAAQSEVVSAVSEVRLHLCCDGRLRGAGVWAVAGAGRR